MYFDAVLRGDMEVRFNGTPEETKAWLEENETDPTDVVVDGKTIRMMSVEEYLARK